MRQNGYAPDADHDIAQYFSRASLPSQQETLGQVVMEILREGKNLNRKSLCTKLLRRLELAASQDEERHYQQLVGMLFGR